MRYGRIGTGPRGKPRVLNPAGQEQDRRRLVNFVFQLPRNSHTAGRNGLAVKNCQIDVTSVEVLKYDGFSRTFHVFKGWKGRMRAFAESQNDLLADIAIIAINQDTQGLVISHKGIVHNEPVATTSAIPASRLHGQEGRPSLVTVGTIVWLSSELMFFAALFAAYFTVRNISPGLWENETAKLNVPFATTNTTILVLSSVACQFGVFAAERGRAGRTGTLLQVKLWGMREWFVLTYFMGAVFIAGQATEYAELIHENITIQSSPYGSLFYLATGFHGLHVTGGLLAFILVIGRTFAARKFTHEQAISAIVVSYYWHFVDIVWIALFAAIYLIQ